MFGKDIKGNVDIEGIRNTTPNVTSTSIIKRSLFIPLVAILFVVLYVGASLIRPKGLDIKFFHTSSQHVAKLQTYWDYEERIKSREDIEEKFVNISPLNITRDSRWSDDYQKIISRRKFLYKQRQQEHKDRRKYFDLIAKELANSTKGSPRYVTYDMKLAHSKVVREGKVPYDCIKLKVVPVTPICLYDSEEDVFVSKQMRELGIWEEHIVKRFQSVLTMDPTLGVIDTGANIGQYSLIAATMGHEVLAVEPWGPSLDRFKTAANMAGVDDKITVLQNSISGERAVICLKTTLDNQGNVYIDRKAKDANCSHSDSIYLDDLLAFVKFKKAVLKLDIQGFEHKAFLHARNLLSKMFIPYIFMEWVMMRDMWVTLSHESLDKAIVRYLIDMLTGVGYEVFSLVSGKKLDIKYWYGWPEDVIWIHESQLRNNSNRIQL